MRPAHLSLQTAPAVRSPQIFTPAAILVQASSRSWAGGTDLCMHRLEGRPLFQHTLERARKLFPFAPIRIVAPEFDRGGLDAAAASVSDCAVGYSFDDKPLLRLIEATRDLDDDAVVLRIDGLHCFFHHELVRSLLDAMEEQDLDIAKAPDDFPPALTGEAWRVGGLRRLGAMLSGWPADRAGPHYVHPKFIAMRKETGLRAQFVAPPEIPESFLTDARRTLTRALDQDYLEVNHRKISAGDQLSFHYVLACRHLKPTDSVLDIASGQCYGGNMMADVAQFVTCADLDKPKLEEGKRLFRRDNLCFAHEDATRMSFPDAVFDVVTSMETIEHVGDVDAYLKELSRVLKPGGRAILSTPQNCIGHIPLTPSHMREFALEDLRKHCAVYFEIEKIVGLKAGTIHFDGDPTGNNTMIFLRKA